MNVVYHKWMEIEVTNSYFTKGLCPVLEFTPFNETAKAFANYNILTNFENNVLSLYAGINEQEAFAIANDFKGMGDIYFQLIVKDPLFFNYSNIPSVEGGKYFYFENNPGKNNLVQLQSSQFVSEKDQMLIKPKLFNVLLPKKKVNIIIKDKTGKVLQNTPVDGNVVTNYQVNLSSLPDGVYQLWINKKVQETFFICTEEIKDNSIGVLHLDMATLIAQYKKQLVCSLSFDARSVFWQYQVVVPPTRKIEVTDMSIEGEIDFNSPQEQQIIGNQRAKVFVTKKPVQLKKELLDGPKLQVTYCNNFSNRKNQLEVKLPNPDAANLKKYNQGKNVGSFFSSIIVYV